MPDSQSSTTDPIPRARGDMYLRAERRRLAELAAELEATGIETPTAAPVYQMEPSTGAPAGTAESSADLAPAVAPARLPGTPIATDGFQAASVAVLEPAPPRPETSRDPTAVPVADAAETPAAPPSQPALRMAAPVRKPRRSAKRSPVPAAVFGTVVAIGVLAITLLVWPSGAGAPPVDSSPDAGQAARPATAEPAVTEPPPAAPTAAAAMAAVPEAGPVAAPPTRQASAPTRQATTPTRATSATRQATAPTRQATQPSRGQAAAATAPPQQRATEGAIRVTSTPPGARVTVNGIGWGQTPLTIDHLPLGAKTVRVTRDGYASQQRLIDLRGDRPSASVHVNLQRGG